ncbi:MAG TPA: aminopeptidase P family protein [Gemmatimonadales bacterium]
MTDLPDLCEARCASLRALLGAQGLDGLIVTHLANIQYLTGFRGSAAVAVVLPTVTAVVTDFRYATQVHDEVGAGTRVETAATDVWQRLWSVIGEYSGVAVLGYERDTVTVATSERLMAAGGSWRLEAAGGLVEQLRARKHPSEVAAIREAAALALDALAATVDAITPGATELGVAASLEHELRRRGSEWHPFPTIVASGPRSALPHARTTGRTLVRGDLVLLDFGAQVNGYCADLSRTFVLGRADERQRAVYDLVCEAQRHARTAMRSGMTGREADDLARSRIAARGFGEAFGHSLGHGIGLEVHEAPRVSRSNTNALPDDAVVTIEPGIYLPGWGGVRIEDNVCLRPDGALLLSDGLTELRELG